VHGESESIAGAHPLKEIASGKEGAAVRTARPAKEEIVFPTGREQLGVYLLKETRYSSVLTPALNSFSFSGQSLTCFLCFFANANSYTKNDVVANGYQLA